MKNIFIVGVIVAVFLTVTPVYAGTLLPSVSSAATVEEMRALIYALLQQVQQLQAQLLEIQRQGNAPVLSITPAEVPVGRSTALTLKVKNAKPNSDVILGGSDSSGGITGPEVIGRTDASGEFTQNSDGSRYDPVTLTFWVTVGGIKSNAATLRVLPSSTANQPPEIRISPNTPENIKVGQSVSFAWTAVDANNDDLSWSVDWGENIGQTTSCSIKRNQNGTGWTYNTIHTWTKPGVYTVKVTVSDCVGGTDSETMTVTVAGDSSNLSPVITGISGPTTLKVGDTGTWTINASDPENGTLSYSILWGDDSTPVMRPIGSVVQRSTFTHRYGSAGNYTVKVSVSDGRESASTSISVTVVNPAETYYILPDKLPDVKVGSSYYQSIAIMQGKEKVYAEMSVAAGSLPPGIELNRQELSDKCFTTVCAIKSSYLLRGRPTVVGTYNFSVIARMINGEVIGKEYSLKVKDPVRDEKEAKIREMYKQYLAREADPEGLSFWMSMNNLETARAGILGSPEYSTRVAKIKALFQDLLGRAPNADELDKYANHGLTLGEIEKQLKPSKYPGFFISFSQKSYLPTETVVATVRRADGATAPYVVDAYIIGTQGLPPYPFRSGIAISQGTIDFEMNTQSAYTGPGHYALLLCNGGQKCDGGVTTNAAGFTVADSVAPQPSITVLSPNGGEHLEIGSILNIKWSGQGLSSSIKDYHEAGNLDIELTKGGGLYQGLNSYCSVVSMNSSGGSLACKIPSNVLAGTYYKIVIIDNTTRVFDASDSYFTITAPTTTTNPSITVLSPNGGEKYVKGNSPTTGDWLSYSANIIDAKMGNFGVYLTARNDAEWRKGYYMPQGGAHDVDGSITKPYVVQGGVQLNNSIMPGDYYLLVEWTDASGVVYRDFSDSYFTIVAVPAVASETITYAPLPLPSAELKPGSNVIYRFSATSADGGVVDISTLKFKIKPTSNLYAPYFSLFAYSDIATKKTAVPAMRRGHVAIKNVEQTGEAFSFQPVPAAAKGIPVAAGGTIYFEIVATVGAAYGESSDNVCSITTSLVGVDAAELRSTCAATSKTPTITVSLLKLPADRTIKQKSFLEFSANVYDPTSTNGVLGFYLAKTNGDDWKTGASFRSSATGNGKLQYPITQRMGNNIGDVSPGTYYAVAEWKNDKGFSMAAFSEPITIVAE